MTSIFNVKDVVLVNFPNHEPMGREQQGTRPSIIVALSSDTGATRFPLIVVAPMTTQGGSWVTQNPTLYPFLQAGVGNLISDSIVLLDQIRAIDIRRIARYLGTLTPEQYQIIEDGLKVLFGF